jgi:hypothetical protein
MPLPLYPRGMFSLTRHERIVLVFILTALVAGAGIRHFRQIAMLRGETESRSASR